MSRFLLFFLYFYTVVACSMSPKLNWDAAIDKAISKYCLRAEPELIHYFYQAQVTYPPQDVALLAFKKEKKLELWARDAKTRWRHIHNYPLTAVSGRLGPKLKERDGQIPEGIYHLVSFNPFSAMHLSMMIDYPNNFDRLQASKDGRTNLGNNIFLHGKSISVGCLAIGDHAIDQLFVLTRRIGLNHAQLIIAPNDLRLSNPATASFAQPRWLPELYRQISIALMPFSQRSFIVVRT